MSWPVFVDYKVDCKRMRQSRRVPTAHSVHNLPMERADFSSQDIPWPRPGDKLIGSGSDWQMNACVNYLGDHSEAYVDGYKAA